MFFWHEHIFSKTLRVIALSASVGLIAGLLSFPGGSSETAYASESLVSCRADAAASNDPYPRYISSTGRSDTVNTVEIVPVYAPVLYIDPRNNYDASYIAYRVKNTSASTALTDLRLTLDSFVGEVRLANPLDQTIRIGDLAPSTSTTLYFLVTAKKDSTVPSNHAVRLTTGAAATRVAACEARITAVERSLAASPNRVTGITVNTTSPTLGDTVVVTVNGAPGKVGSSSGGFTSIMTLSPASSSSWPTRSLRLEGVETEIRGLQSANIETQCKSNGAVDTGGGGNTPRFAKFTQTLVLVNFGACATTVKQTYTSTYTFRVIAPAQSNPIIRPLADITSGQKVKYTGSLPATDTTVALASTTVPLEVKKTANATPEPTSTDTHIDIRYTVTAKATSGTVRVDAIIDKPDGAIKPSDAFQSARFRDVNNSSFQNLPPPVIDDAGKEIRFEGPFTASTSTSTDVVIEYVMRLPRDGGNFLNRAYGLSGSYVIGSDPTSVDVVTVGTTTDGDGKVTVTTAKEPAPLVEQIIVFELPDSLGEGDELVLTGFSDSGLPLTYSVSDASVCTVVEVDGVFTLYGLSQGTCEVTATQAGTSTYKPVTNTQTVNIIGSQRILVAQQTPFSGGSATVVVYATSGLSPTLQSIDTDVCTTGDPTAVTDPGAQPGAKSFTILEKSAGLCILVSNQAGGNVGSDEDPVLFAPAPELEITIGAGKTQTVAFVSPAANSSQPGGVGTSFHFDVVAEAKDGSTELPHVISFSSLTPSVCSVVIVITGGEVQDGYSTSTKRTTRKIEPLAAGTCTILASQDGLDVSGNPSGYAPASASRSFTITSGNTAQNVAFVSPPDTKTYGDSSFPVLAVSTAAVDGKETGLLVTLAVVEGSPCTVGPSTLTADNESRAVVTLSGAGNCLITASQAGNFTYSAAAVKEIKITVSPKNLEVTGLSVGSRVYDGTTGAVIGGTPTLSGVVPGDSSSAVALSGTPTGTFAQPDVGDNIAVNVDEESLSLVGTKTASYTLTLPSLTGQITRRPLTLKPDPVTLVQNTTPPEVCQVSTVSSTTLATGDSVAANSVLCVYNNENPTTAQSTVGTFAIRILAGSEAPVIRRNGTDVTSNYDVSYLEGTLNVQDASDFVVIEISDTTPLEITYGETIPDDFFSEPVAKKNGNPLTRGTDGDFEFLLPNGNSLQPTTRLVANTAGVTVTVAFTEQGSTTPVTATRQIKINPRPVTIDVSGLTRVYDGTSDFEVDVLPLAGTSAPISGVLADDEAGADPVRAQITQPGQLNGTGAGTRSLTWQSAPTLIGDAAANYELELPTTVTVTITKRPIRIQASDESMLVGDPIPSFTLASAEDPAHPNAANRGVAPGRPLSEVLGDNATVDVPSTPTVGEFDAVPNVPSNDNYDIEKLNGKLYVADIRIDNLQINNDGVLTDPTFVCSCEGLAPNTAVQVFVFSDPVELTKDITFTTDSNGACPDNVEFTIPDEIFNTAEGADPDHTIRVFGFFPTDDLSAEPGAVRERPVTMAPAAMTVTTNPPPVSGTNPPSVVSPRPPQIVQPPLLPTPLVSPNPLAPGPLSNAVPPSTGNNLPGTLDQQPQNGGATTSPNQATPSQPSLGSPLSGVANRAQDPANTFDLGVEGLSPAELVGNGSTSRAGTRTVSEIREERLGGFDPGTALRVEVIGSRTTARFVISTLTGLDELVLIEQITRSSAGNRTDFAGVDRVGIGSPTGPQDPWRLDERDSAYDLFNYSRLAAPTKQSDLLGSSPYTWLNIEKGVKGYLPGSTVYLTATSSPVVFGETQVGPDGQAIVNGDLAVELLGLGEHRIRVIGTRVFQGIQVDSDGEVIIPDFVLEQILLFDMGTDATVIVTGNNPTGGVHTVMRVVPLDPVSPWWTLWVIAWTALLLLLARMRGMIRTLIEKSVAGGAVLVSSIPALYLGWTTTVTQVAWWGLLMGLGLSLAVWLVPSLRREHPQVGDRLA